MLPNQIKQSDVLDIIFEHRNKTYGAYALRKSYNKRLALALTFTLLVAAMFSVLQLLDRSAEPIYATIVNIDDSHLIDLAPTPPPQQPLPPAPAQQSPVHSREIITSTPEIVSDVHQTTVPTIEDLNNSTVGRQISEGDIPLVGTVVSPAGNGNAQPANVPAAEPAMSEAPLHTAEFMPEFPGGLEALKKFLLKNIRQPDDLQPGEKIVVRASFIVARNGSIEQMKIINSGRADLDKEVLRVIGKMPSWKPGVQNGHEVSVYFNLPVTFVGADVE
ncbi:MAG TPA: energy transducer TonB [Parafilimonas sp.]|nr:energy transducer TonB [Parafilimonas sp.]